MQMQKQQGFTLIELVVVIIILGILAVVAAPKFINLQGDARASALSGVKGAIQGANTLVYSKAALAGEEKGAATKIDIGSGTKDLNIVYGYIKATEADLETALDVTFDEGTVGTTDDPTAATATATTGADWIIKTPSKATGTVEIWQAGAPATCVLTYTQATDLLTPKFSVMPDADDC
jgi:MSHA pilin protein MshA